MGARCHDHAPSATLEQLLFGVGVVGVLCARLTTVGMALEAVALASVAALSAALNHVDGSRCYVATERLRALPCLWASMACHAGPSQIAPLLLQFWLSLCGTLVLLVGTPVIRQGSWAAALACGPLVAVGLAAVGWQVELLCGLLFVGVCQLLFDAAFVLLPGCFTLGEAAFGAQGLASVVHAAVCTLVSSADRNEWRHSSSSWAGGSLSMELLAVLCSSTLGTLGLLWLVRPWLRTVNKGISDRYKGASGRATDDIDSTRVACALLFAMTTLYAPLLWRTLSTSTSDAASRWEQLLTACAVSDFRCVAISAYWLAIIGLIPAIPRIQAGLQLPQIAARKLFHALALMLFFPIISSNDIEFLALSMAVATNLFVLCEMLRICRVPPFGMHLQRFMEPFIDQKDHGVAVLTHIYLLVGCAIPVWCDVVLRAVPNKAGQTQTTGPTLLPFGGLLSIGVLDSLAAVCGKRYGRTKWTGTSKTVEGTLCAIAGTLTIAYITDIYVCGGRAQWVEIVVPLVIVALLEACTHQIDNLVLPVVCAILMLAVKNQ